MLAAQTRNKKAFHPFPATARVLEYSLLQAIAPFQNPPTSTYLFTFLSNSHQNFNLF